MAKIIDKVLYIIVVMTIELYTVSRFIPDPEVVSYERTAPQR